jgi:hypothetical protein
VQFLSLVADRDDVAAEADVMTSTAAAFSVFFGLEVMDFDLFFSSLSFVLLVFHA